MDTVDNDHAELHTVYSNTYRFPPQSASRFIWPFHSWGPHASLLSYTLSVVWKLQAHSLISLWSFIMEQVYGKENPAVLLSFPSSANTAMIATSLTSFWLYFLAVTVRQVEALPILARKGYAWSQFHRLKKTLVILTYCSKLFVHDVQNLDTYSDKLWTSLFFLFSGLVLSP